MNKPKTLNYVILAPQRVRLNRKTNSFRRKIHEEYSLNILH